MDDLESAMNIDELFEKYKEYKVDTINLKQGLIKITLMKVANSSKVIHIDYYYNLDIYYKIHIYFNPKKSFHYTFIDGEMIQGKEIMVNHAKEFHPEFFEWIIWNLP